MDHDDADRAEPTRSGPADRPGRDEAVTPAPTATVMPPPPPTETPPPPPPSPAYGPALAPAQPLPPRVATPLKPAWLIGAAATAVAADLALRRFPWNSAAMAVLVLVLAAGLAVSGYLTSRTSRVLAAAAVFFGLFLAIRTEAVLTGFNFVLAFGLLVLAAVHGRSRRFWDLGPARLALDGLTMISESVLGLVEVPAEAAAHARTWRDRADTDRNRAGYAVLRGLALTVPIVAVLALLLASADAVFQSFITFDGPTIDGASLVGHAILLAFGAYGFFVLLRLAHTGGGPDPQLRFPSLGPVEAGMILAAVNALFALFALAQILTVSGGADAALERAGLDPKEFARQGFFQLLFTAGLTLGLLMVLRMATVDRHPAARLVRLLAPVTVALTLVIVAVALTRISFYVADGGLTPLRFHAAVTSGWIAVAFIITAVRIWGVAPHTRWLLPVLLVSALATVAVLNLVNPEAIIARENLARDDDAVFWHVDYGQYTGEGTARLINGLDQLPPETRARVVTRLCGPVSAVDHSPGDWLSFNLGRHRGDAALDELCG